MKTIWLSLFVFITGNLFAQNPLYEGLLQGLYLDRQPSPVAESMGGGLTAYTKNEFGAFYNPALTSLNAGLTFNYSHSKNYKWTDNGEFNNFNISFIILELPLFKFYTKEEENTQDLIFNIVDSTRNAIMTNLKI